jgi:excisionase family DNA binding protein
MPNERLTMSVAEASRAIGIARGSYYQAIARGEVPFCRVGGRLLVPIRALDHWLERVESERTDGRQA